MKRIVQRMLPDGSIKYFQPFHISVEGLEKCVLYRDDEDYDAMVKIICIAALRKSVIVIIYAVVSNHCHVAVLASSQKDADDYGKELKRIYAMWFRKKYRVEGIMKEADVKAICLDNDWYVRNALAYIPRNALDNGCNVNDYPWSGYSAMFSPMQHFEPEFRKVSDLTKRERLAILHTGDTLGNVAWRLDQHNSLIPRSFCDYKYLEQAFENSQAFFLKIIGGQNAAEMKTRLLDMPRKMQTDGEFLKSVEEICQRWFQTDSLSLSLERKSRLIPYINRTMKTSIPQLARVFGLSRQTVLEILNPK